MDVMEMPGRRTISHISRVLALRALAVTALTTAGAHETEAQIAVGTVQPPPERTDVRVFLDCQGQLPCNRDHFRTELLFVNWAQDREDSDVHVIATSQAIAGGGRQIALDFIGRGSMEELAERLTFTSSGTAVQVETLDGLTQTLRLGLLRYAVAGGLGENFDIRFTGNLPGAQPGQTGTATPAQAMADRWNYWTFEVGLSGNANIRETSESLRVSPGFSADRVTEAWKLGFEVETDIRRESRQLSDGRSVRDDRNDWEVEALVVRSMGNHFSGGFTLEAQNSISNNRRALVGFSPAMEYNYFPYLVANRRQFTVLYSAGLEYSNYIEETVFNQLSEARPVHELRVRYSAREQWGNAGIGIDYSQYLNDLELYSTGVNGNLNFRITRGLQLNLNGNASLVNNEIYIPRSDCSAEEILLNRCSLPSAYQYSGSIGLSYRWGSPFANIVNTRFSSQGGGGGGF